MAQSGETPSHLPLAKKIETVFEDSSFKQVYLKPKDLQDPIVEGLYFFKSTGRLVIKTPDFETGESSLWLFDRADMAITTCRQTADIAASGESSKDTPSTNYQSYYSSIENEITKQIRSDLSTLESVHDRLQQILKSFSRTGKMISDLLGVIDTLQSPVLNPVAAKARNVSVIIGVITPEKRYRDHTVIYALQHNHVDLAIQGLQTAILNSDPHFEGPCKVQLSNKDLFSPNGGE